MEEKMRVQDICCQVLAELGWQLIDSTVIAMRTFKTAAGMRDAHVYLSNGDGYNFSLRGQYSSVGNNILGARGVLIPINSPTDAIKNYATDFCVQADKAIEDSYARRLFVKYG